jgi:hypothetical protein
MLRMCVLTVFGETDRSRAISSLDRFVGRYRSTLSSPGLSSSVPPDGPVRLGEGECALGGLVRRPLVTEFPVGEPGEQMSFHHREVPDDRYGAVQDIPLAIPGRCR